LRFIYILSEYELGQNKEETKFRGDINQAGR